MDAPAEPDDGEVPAAGPADFAAYDALTVLTPRQRAAIVDAYAKVFQPRPSDAERLALIVNPSGLESVITGLRKYASSAALDTARVRVKETTFVDRTHASVEFAILSTRRQAFAGELDAAGGAVFVDGRWKLTRASFCAVMREAGKVTGDARVYCPEDAPAKK